MYLFSNTNSIKHYLYSVVNTTVMRNLKFLLASVGVAASLHSSAQDLNEAYNLSNTTPQGTARSIGFGGALGSIGGDFSSISVNPAGLGVYRTSELSFTPSLKINFASSTFQGGTRDDNNVRATINNFGVVFTEAPKGIRYDRRAWKAVSFAIGMNRVADFNHDYSYDGTNYSSSASLAFEADANAYPGAITPGTLAYTGVHSGIISISGLNYYTAVPFAGGIEQRNVIRERGGINEYVFSLGGNYKERLLLGVTLGVPSIKYYRNSDYTETILASNNYNPGHFQTFTYNNQLNITGTGANLKIGAIYKVADFFRIGAAFHTPTLYNLSEVTDYGINSVVNNVHYAVSTANYLPQNRFDYSFVSPFKSVVSASLILKKLGFITADLEYVDYGTMRFYYPDGFNENTGISYKTEADQMNQSVSATYQSAANLRVGAEIKLTKYLMIRGGAGYYGNPYKTGTPMERIDVSAGLGFRSKNFFADFGMVNSMYKFGEQAYSEVNYNYVATANTNALPPVATVGNSINNIAMTIGVKF